MAKYMILGETPDNKSIYMTGFNEEHENDCYGKYSDNMGRIMFDAMRCSDLDTAVQVVHNIREFGCDWEKKSQWGVATDFSDRATSTR